MEPSEVIYVVTGLAGHGTTMMMKCLEAGGIPIWDKERCSPNTHETNFRKYYSGEWNMQESPPVGGTCIKSIGTHKEFAPLFDDKWWKVIVMARDMTERLVKEDWLYAQRWGDNLVKWAHDEHVVKHLGAINIVDYNRMLLEPEVVFNNLVMSGWEIDPVKAAAIVDPSKNNGPKLERIGYDVPQAWKRHTARRV